MACSRTRFADGLRTAAAVAIASVCVCVGATAGAAAVEASFHAAGGFYRPGRFVPVHISAAFAGAPRVSHLIVRADNAIAIGLDLTDGRADVIVPMFVLDRPANVRWEWIAGGSRPKRLAEGTLPEPGLRLLERGHKLVGTTNDDAAFAQSLFPGARIERVRLDGARPLAGPAAAWEMLDAVVLDSPEAARLAESIPTLLAAGTIVAVKGDDVPLPDWPWERAGEYNVLRIDLAGPTEFYPDSDPDPDSRELAAAVYAPVRGGDGGWPAEVRWRIVLFAGIFAAAAVGVSLLPRWAAGAMVVVSAGAVGLMWAWGQYQVPIHQRSGEIMAMRAGLMQVDAWTYQTSSNAWPSEMLFAGLCRPVLRDREQIGRMSMMLFCNAGGDPCLFGYDMRPDEPVAFLSRRVGPQPPTAVRESDETSPLDALARKLYLRPGESISTGAHTTPTPRRGYGPTEVWPGVTIRAAGP